MPDASRVDGSACLRVLLAACVLAFCSSRHFDACRGDGSAFLHELELSINVKAFHDLMYQAYV